jgi:hypothetical protein
MTLLRREAYGSGMTSTQPPLRGVAPEIAGQARAVRCTAALVDLPVPDDERAEELARSLRTVDNDPFLQAVSARRVRLCHRSVTTLVSHAGRGGFSPAPEPTWSPLLRAVHLSFAAHVPLSLSPDVLWFTVVHEVAVHVRLNAEQYAGLFTDAPGHRQEIRVRDDSLLDPEPDWSRSIRLVLEPLRERLGSEVTDLFLPRFSTTTPDDVSSALVALMSVVSPYYRFEWLSLCGIPRIRLEGVADDWRLLAHRVRELASWFEGLRPWFEALCPVLEEIAATAAGGEVDTDFWRSFYKWESLSGGEYVSGWITVLFAHTQSPAGPVPKESFRWRRGERYLENAFPSHVAAVPFRWTRPDGVREMRFMAGILGIERDGAYLRPRLGHAVSELLPTEPDPADGLLPDGWTHDRLREVTGCATARALTLDWTIPAPTEDGWPTEIQPTHVIQVAMYCYVRSATDGMWYVGDLLWESREIVLWERLGTDLAEALRRF